MMALSIGMLVVGVTIAWDGPFDPEYLEDWVLWSVGMGLALVGLWMLTGACIPKP